MVLTCVANGDIGSTIEKLKEVARGSSTLPLRIAAARRVLELTGETCCVVCAVKPFAPER